MTEKVNVPLVEVRNLTSCAVPAVCAVVVNVSCVYCLVVQVVGRTELEQQPLLDGWVMREK